HNVTTWAPGQEWFLYIRHVFPSHSELQRNLLGQYSCYPKPTCIIIRFLYDVRRYQGVGTRGRRSAPQDGSSRISATCHLSVSSHAAPTAASLAEHASRNTRVDLPFTTSFIADLTLAT